MFRRRTTTFLTTSALAVLALATGCHAPTEAPEVTDACTITTVLANGVLIRACYRHCPDGAEAFAKANGQVFAPRWLCGGALA